MSSRLKHVAAVVQDHDQFNSCDNTKGHNGLGSLSSSHIQHSFHHHVSSNFISGGGAAGLQQGAADGGMHLVQNMPDGLLGPSRLVEVGCNSFGQQSHWQGMGGAGGISLPQNYLGKIPFE